MYCCSIKENPVLSILHLVAMILLIYALWTHRIWIVLIILVAGIIMHLMKHSSNKKIKKKRR